MTLWTVYIYAAVTKNAGLREHGPYPGIEHGMQAYTAPRREELEAEVPKSA